jgi:hypothetical protein
MRDLLGHQVHLEVGNMQDLGVIEKMKERGNLITVRASDQKCCRALAKAVLESAGMPATEALKKRLARKFKERWRDLRQEAGIAMPSPKSENDCMEQIVPLLNRMGIPAAMPDDPGIFWELSIAK